MKHVTDSAVDRKAENKMAQHVFCNILFLFFLLTLWVSCICLSCLSIHLLLANFPDLWCCRCPLADVSLVHPPKELLLTLLQYWLSQRDAMSPENSSVGGKSPGRRQGSSTPFLAHTVMPRCVDVSGPAIAAAGARCVWVYAKVRAVRRSTVKRSEKICPVIFETQMLHCIDFS